MAYLGFVGAGIPGIAATTSLTEVASYDLVVLSPSYAVADGQLYAAHASGVDVPYAWKDLPHVLLGGDRLSILPGDALADLTSGPWTNSSTGKAAKVADGPLTITAGAYGEWLTAGPAAWMGAGVKRVALGIKATRGAGRPAVCIWSAPEEGGTTRGLWVDLYSASGSRARFVTSNGATLQSADGGPVDYDGDAPVWLVVDWSQADALSRSAPSWVRSALGQRQAQIARTDMTVIGGFDGHLWVAPNLDVGGTGTLSLDWMLVLDATSLEV
jgi:hypothetical protein